MKIVCDNCATKYSIADEKVRGKVFKIRCKKCSHIIVVKGTEGGSAEVGSTSGDAPPAEPAAPEASAADGWHVVINGEQVGPLQPAEIRAKFHAGEIDSESYAWREGFGDWQRLASIDEFHDLQPASPPDSTRRTDDIFGGEPAPAPAGGDLFGAPSGDLFAGGPPATAAPAGGGGGLFAQSESPVPSKRSPTPGFGQPAMTDAPPVDAKMTGQRNESSVLFSLNNLQALASGGGAKASPGGAGAVENRPGFANSQTEGSGLIDIRAMAAATLSSSPPAGDSRANDIPSFSSAPVFSPIAAPILMPSAPSGPPKWIWPVIALGVAAVASIIVVGVLILNKKPEVAAVAPTPPGTTAAPTPGTAAPTPGTTAPTPTPTPGTTAAANPGTTAPTPEAKNDKGSTPSTGGHEHGKKGGKTTVAASPGSPKTEAKSTPSEPPPPTPTKKGKSKDELDDLLNGATHEDKPKAARAERAEPAGGNDADLPDQLDKTAIVSGMGKVKAKVQGCYEQFKVPGIATVAVTIGRNGRVSNAAVSGSFAGTPTGECVAKAVKGATFSQFKGSPQTINYPYSLR